MTSLDNTRTDDTVVASFAFTLDANGNRTSIIEEFPLAAMPGAENTNYAYNTAKNRLESAGTLTFTHDLEGQLATRGSNGYAFDYAHRLKTVTGTNPASFVYDGAGNRIAATRDTVTTRYIYDPAGNLLATADANNTILNYFVHGQGLLAMVTPTDQTYCYHFDGMGNTIAMTDNSQYSVNQYAYTPFGILLEEQETVPQPFKYVGQFGVMAEPDGLYYMRARYYDPQVGRFISEDPIGFEGGDVNLYAYCKNNPVMFVDPDGLLRIPGTGKIIGWGTKWVAKKIGGKLGEKIGELAGFFNPEIGYPSEQQKMDKDTDGDGINDFFDPDDYNNGVPNVSDVQPINYSEDRTLANK